MALTIPLPPPIAPKCAGLDVWMERVLERAAKLDQDWDPDGVHDLRVALRRCRTMADALRQVNPSPGWRKLKKSSKNLFQALGALRDTQVERKWLKTLGHPGDQMRKRMLRLLSDKEKKSRQTAHAELDAFDRKEWRKLARKLDAKAHFFPLESVVFQRLALAKLNEAATLYQQARKCPSGIAWHRVRIGIKRFRYIVENFLPPRYEAWAPDLKRAQDLLGDVHDMDVLRAEIRRHAAKFDANLVAQWHARIGSERNARLEEFLSQAAGPHSPWRVWRAGFHPECAIVAVPFSHKKTA